VVPMRAIRHPNHGPWRVMMMRSLFIGLTIA